MALKFKHKAVDDADLDVTSFMNLMIVLVPVMLLSLTFSQLKVHEIQLADLSPSLSSSEETPSKLEVLLTAKGIKVFYPSNTLVKEIPMVKTSSQTNTEDAAQAEEGISYDFNTLSLVLQSVKQQLNKKRDVLILSEKTIDYQTLVSAMDAVKSYKTVMAASVVEVELFPEISLADASIK